MVSFAHLLILMEEERRELDWNFISARTTRVLSSVDLFNAQ